ncbi:unnamed protein product [Paramecium octaurelia]|uniref:Uncharacterized protein n=1 Tax=Paramecium octaurelia TaxID=43137 RepID=A0A8S1VVD1_PAROT|nr:unnamed protein product [Paramecium octaurelia]
MDFNGPQEAYEDLLRTIIQIRSVEPVKKDFASDIVFLKCGIPKLQKGQAKLYKEEMKPKEVSLEQVDVAYIQLYAFLFGSLGINDIVSSYKEIAKFFGYKSDPQFLICRIAQTDYNLIQCVGDMFGNEFLKRLKQIIPNNLLRLVILPKLLKKFSYDSSWDLQNIILGSCELNQDNEQLQLKRSPQPVQYEPIFASLVLELKEQITEKLKTQNDKQSELFGAALAYELSQINEHKSTLTYKRLAILKAIVLDQEQQVLQNIIEQIQGQQELGLIQNISQILEDYSVYINLYLSSIFSICLQFIQNFNLTQTSNSIYEIFARQLDETFSLNSSQVENDAQRACKSQLLKRKVQNKFENMGSALSIQITEVPPEMSNDNCSLCQLQFEKQEIQYHALLTSYTNINKHINAMPQKYQQTNKQTFSSLLFQLLSDLNKFKLKNTHLLLQDVLALLRILFQSNQTTVLEEVVQNDQQTLFRILNLILQFMIKQNNINDLKSGLCLIFNNNINQSAIIQALTENLIISQIEQKSLPYYLDRISKDLKQHYINKFLLNFKELLLRYYLHLTKNKNVNFAIVENGELGADQYLCLICLKKMCTHYCGRPQNTQFGNLSRHCQKRHSGKTLYLNLKTVKLSSCNRHTSHFTFTPYIKIQQENYCTQGIIHQFIRKISCQILKPQIRLQKLSLQINFFINYFKISIKCKEPYCEFIKCIHKNVYISQFQFYFCTRNIQAIFQGFLSLIGFTLTPCTKAD